MATIPLPEGEDIYTLGFDKTLNKTIDTGATGVVYDTVENTLNTGSVVTGGNLNLKTLTVGGLVKQVAPGDDIQAAIDAVSREGGGTVQLLAKTYLIRQILTMRDKVVLAGAGKDVTVLDFDNGLFGIVATAVGNFGVRDLNVENTSANGIDIQAGCFSFGFENLTIAGHVVGLKVSDSSNFSLSNCLVSENSSHGVHLSGGDTFSMFIVRSQSNGGSGFQFDTPDAGSLTRNFTMISCRAVSNTGDGYDFDSAVTHSNSKGVLSGCVAQTNTGTGFDIDADVSNILFTNCVADSNGGDGFEVAGASIRIIGCESVSNSTVNWDFVTGTQNLTLIGNYISGAGGTNSSSLWVESDNVVISQANVGGSPRTEKKFFRMKNTSGADLRVGNVVVFNSAASGEEVTTTTTNGDNKVFGVVLETVQNNVNQEILTEGYTTQLYVTNGTASISIGDWLSTYSHAYYAKKATAGDTAFAIALSTPTTSTAQINAVLFSPRLI